MFCGKCGTEMSDNATACPKCGEPTKNAAKIREREHPVGCFFLGFFLSFIGLIIAAIIDKKNWLKALWGMIASFVVGAILGIAIPSIVGRAESANFYVAKTAVDNIKSATTAYMIAQEKSVPPRDLKVLIDANGDNEPFLEGGEEALIDPWGHPYQMSVKGKRFAITSAGPDGKFGTEDDISTK